MSRELKCLYFIQAFPKIYPCAIRSNLWNFRIHFGYSTVLIDKNTLIVIPILLLFNFDELLMRQQFKKYFLYFYCKVDILFYQNTMSCWKEEIFGPVAAIASFDTEEDAVAEANNTDRGLAGYLFSKDYSQIWRVSRQLEFGMIGVNDVGISTPETPFGGYKTSGIGKEGTKMGLDEYSNVKLIDMGGL